MGGSNDPAPKYIKDELITYPLLAGLYRMLEMIDNRYVRNNDDTFFGKGCRRRNVNVGRASTGTTTIFNICWKVRHGL